MGDDPLLRIEWEMYVNDLFSHSGPFGEPDSYVACYEGRIFLVDDEEEEHVGLVKARRCLLGDASPFMVLDAEAELDTYCNLFTGQGWFRQDVAEMFGDLLVLDRMGLARAHRGRDLGLTVIREVVRQIGSGCGAVAMMPRSLEYDQVTGAFTVLDDQRGTERLERYYRRLGFKKRGEILHFDLARPFAARSPRQ